MNRFERMLFPVILLVGIGAILLARAEMGPVIVIARVIGITLIALLAVGMVARTIVKLKRARAAQADLLAELEKERDALEKTIAAEEAAAGDAPS